MTPQETVPQKSAGYLYAQSVFYQQFNEINFFVEDIEQENLYFIIIRCLFPKIQIAKIFPLGGKSQIITHAHANSTAKKSVYIVDKDFDDLLEKFVQLPNVFYLERFCIENYVLEEGAVVRFVISEKPRMKAPEVQKKLNFLSFLTSSLGGLQPLFALFLLAQRKNLELKTTSLGVHKFCVKRTCAISNEEIINYQNQLEAAAAAKKVDLKPEDFRKADSETRPPAHKTISGKFVLSLLGIYLANLFSIGSVSSDSLLYRLAEYCEFQSLLWLRDTIAKYLSTIYQKVPVGN